MLVQRKWWPRRLTKQCNNATQNAARWAHDVVATLNQRHLHLFKVATTSCASGSGSAYFSRKHLQTLGFALQYASPANVSNLLFV